MDRPDRIKHIARAFELIAIADHYMVGFIDVSSTWEELEMAQQILIIRSNTFNNKDKSIEKALDLIEQEIKGKKL